MSDPQAMAELENAIDQTLSADLTAQDPDAIMQALGQELEQQSSQSVLVLSASEEPEAWVLGAGEGSGDTPQGVAGRFIGFYGAALRRELCDEAGGCLKEQYRSKLESTNLKASLGAIAPAVLAAIGASTALIAPAIVAALVATWLLRVGLDQWCASSTPVAAGDAAQP